MGLLDAISPTPRNKVLGLLSDLFGSVDAYANKPQPGMPMGKANPVLGLLSDAFGIGGTARTLDRLSYGEPITNIGKANVPLIPQDTADAALSAVPAAQLYGKALKFAAPKAAQMLENHMARTGAIQPVLAWHGTPSQDFEKFSLSHFGKTDGGWLGKGIYGAESPIDASAYAAKNGTPAGAVYRVDMDINNPLKIDWESPDKSALLAMRRELGAEGFSKWLKDNGYDGVHFLGPKNALNSAGHRDIQWMALDPEQVRQVSVSAGT